MKRFKCYKSPGTYRVTTQAHEGIETLLKMKFVFYVIIVTTQAREGIETAFYANLGEGL